jgi:hypothetical protein
MWLRWERPPGAVVRAWCPNGSLARPRLGILDSPGKPLALTARRKHMTLVSAIQAMNDRLIFTIASTPGQRAGFVGLVMLRIIELIVAVAAIAFIWWGCLIGFAKLWNNARWFVISWGISGPLLLLAAYIRASSKLYWAGGIDLGVFLVIWFFAAVNQTFDQV